MIDLDALAALLDKATPGPWRVRETTESQYQPRVLQAKYVMAALEDYDRSRTDAALIVAAVNALPALIAYVRELERERDQANKTRDVFAAGMIRAAEHLMSGDDDAIRAAALAMRERCAEICSKAARERTSDPTSWATAADCAAAVRALEI